MHTDKNFNDSLKKAIDIVRKGGVVLYPTDTVWGLGCDASNSEAVKRIFRIKQRDDAKSMLSLVSSERMLEQFVQDIPDIAWQLIEASINPLTIIYDHPIGISPLLLASDGSAGFRITNEKFSQALCSAIRKPIVSTSANISGEPAPEQFSRITEKLLKEVDYVVEYGRESQPAKPSNIVKLSSNSVFKIIR